MKLRLEVTPIGGEPYQVTTNLFTVIAWERRFKSKASALANALGLEDLAFLAYEAAKQAQIVVPVVFDDFLQQVDSVTVVEADPTNPTLGAHTADH